MRKLVVLFCLLVANVAFAGQQSAGWKLMPSLMYTYSNVQNGTSIAAANRILGDAGLGIMFQGSPLFVGGLISYDSTTNSGASTDKDVFTSYGASMGLLTDTIYMIVTYIASSQYDQTASSILTTFTGGSGFQFSVGYLFSISQSMSLGPQFSYKSVNYSQQKGVSGVTTSANYTHNTLLPFLTLIISL